jgi:ankyrin repeat protein
MFGGAQDAAGATAAQLAAAGGHVEVVARLLDAANARSDKGLSALHLAAQAGSQPLVQALLALPSLDVNARDSDGMTALHWASSKGAAPAALNPNPTNQPQALVLSQPTQAEGAD